MGKECHTCTHDALVLRCLLEFSKFIISLRFPCFAKKTNDWQLNYSSFHRQQDTFLLFLRRILGHDLLFLITVRKVSFSNNQVEPHNFPSAMMRPIIKAMTVWPVALMNPNRELVQRSSGHTAKTRKMPWNVRPAHRTSLAELHTPPSSFSNPDFIVLECFLHTVAKTLSFPHHLSDSSELVLFRIGFSTS